MILTGRYVSLRPLVPDDAEITHKWRESPRAFLLNRGARNVEEQRAWIASRPDTEQNFIQQLVTGEPVGMLSLVEISHTHKTFEMGHFLIGEPELVKPYGNGVIAAEASRLLYDYAFDVLKLHSQHGPIASENSGMLAWARYIGVKEEGRLKDFYFLNGHYMDAVWMGCTQDDYRNIMRPRLSGLIGD